MKKYYFGAIALAMMLFAACGDDGDEDSGTLYDTDITVSLNNFYSTYNYNDTYHDINVTDDYRTFHSEHDLYIQTRVLFYNSNGVLVDSLIKYTTNINEVNISKGLPAGKYTVVTTLTFAEKTTGDDASWWWLADKQKLSTAKMNVRNRFSKWSILSYAATEVNIVSGQRSTIRLNPRPVGALGYLFFQNFQYKNESTYGTVADNNIRELCVYGRNVAVSYRLDPDASDHYIYMDDAGSSYWYYISNELEPSDFNSSWTYFKTNLYSYFYILSPNPEIIFGYTSKGESSFTGYGQKTVSITSGNTYLAYWDYFQVGNPYFGVANNNQWHTYSQARAAEPGQHYSVIEESTPSAYRFSMFK